MSSLYVPKQHLAQQISKQFGTPVFVTDQQTLIDRVTTFRQAFQWPTEIFYAIKANYNPSVIKILQAAGIDGIDTVSPYEVELAKKLGFQTKQIIFTGNNSSNDELTEVYNAGVLLNIGSLSELQRFGAMFPGAKISMRFNPGIGAGECAEVITAGEDAMFGISKPDIAQAKTIIHNYQLKVIGIHCHIGSGFYATKNFKLAVNDILKQATEFTNLEFIDFGGGFGVRYQPDQKLINLMNFFLSIKPDLEAFSQQNHKQITIRFEPGKFLVAESTVLLTQVTTVRTAGKTTFIGTDTGFNHLIRPAFYGSQHHIINLSKAASAPLIKVNVIGNICESTDVLGKDVLLNQPEEGDLLVILTAGAYGSAMSSLYNLRPYAAEVLVTNNNAAILTRKRLSADEILHHSGYDINPRTV